jgi:hypothetical protein
MHEAFGEQKAIVLARGFPDDDVKRAILPGEDNTTAEVAATDQFPQRAADFIMNTARRAISICTGNMIEIVDSSGKVQFPAVPGSGEASQRRKIV